MYSSAWQLYRDTLCAKQNVLNGHYTSTNTVDLTSYVDTFLYQTVISSISNNGCSSEGRESCPVIGKLLVCFPWLLVEVSLTKVLTQNCSMAASAISV